MKKKIKCSTPMNIMILTEVLWSDGGAERNVYLLTKELIKRGHTVITCCFKGGALSKRMQDEGIRVEDLSVERIYNLKGLKAIFKLASIIKREDISLLLAYHKASDYVAILLSILTNIPAISNRRDMGYELTFLHQWLYRIINPFFKHIITPSLAVKKTITKNQWAKPSDITVIHNGVDLSLYDNNTHNEETANKEATGKKFINIGYVANIRPIKGHISLVQAAKLVAAKFPLARFQLIGHYFNDNCYNEIAEFISKNDLKDVVNFAGFIPQSQIPAILDSMDISINTSFSEGMSNALLESMAAGKPAIATSVGGNPEIVEDGQTGFLVKSGDPQSIAQALLRLLTDADLCQEMGLRAKSRIVSEFSLERMVEKYEDLLKYVYLKKMYDSNSFLKIYYEKFKTSLKRFIKVCISGFVYHIGLISAFRWIKRIFRLGRPKILSFHDISKFSNERQYHGMSITPSLFAEFLDFLSDNYDILSVEEVVRLLKTKEPLANDVFALTFDDYYKGWVNSVLPVCLKLDVPYTVFVNTYPLDSDYPVLHDALFFLAENTWRKVADLSSWNLGIFLLNNSDNILKFVAEVHDCWKGREFKERMQFINELSQYFGVSLNSEKLKNIMLTWGDLFEIDKSNVTIGAHTVSHPFLSALDPSESFWEISQNKKRLEEKLGHEINFFAYPYGNFESYNKTVMNIVEDAGFDNAFTLETTNNKGFRPFEISRRNITHVEFARFSGNIHRPILSVELSGLGDLIFGRIFN